MKKLFFLLFIFILAVSCSDDEQLQPDPQEETFNIHDPVGYYMLFHIHLNNSSRVYVMEFLPNDNIRVISALENYTSGYTIDSENTIVFNSFMNATKIKITNGEITEFIFNGFPTEGSFEIIKEQENNQFAGNLYDGYYKISNNTYLHPHFFYQFHTEEAKVDAGLNIGTVLRTDNYESIGNIAIKINTPNYADPTQTDTELLVWMNGKLEANYYNQDEGQIYFGTFTKQ